jgi:hypothetical protein
MNAECKRIGGVLVPCSGFQAADMRTTDMFCVAHIHFGDFSDALSSFMIKIVTTKCKSLIS